MPTRRLELSDLPREMADMAGLLRDGSLKPVTDRWHELANQGVRDNFTSSASPDNQNWPERKHVGDGHPLLIDAGALLQAATGGGAGHVGRAGDRELEAGVSLDTIPYARVHNYGDPLRHMPKREYLGMRANRLEEAEQALADYVDEVI